MKKKEVPTHLGKWATWIRGSPHPLKMSQGNGYADRMQRKAASRDEREPGGEGMHGVADGEKYFPRFQWFMRIEENRPELSFGWNLLNLGLFPRFFRS